MPIVTGTVTAVVNLAAEVERQLTASGNAARATLGERPQAFAWLGPGYAWAGAFSTALVDGLTYRSVIVKPSGTPVAKVAPGGAKPAAVSVTTGSATLPKYAGMATVKTEDILDSTGLIAAIEAVILDQAITAFEADIALALEDAAGAASGATWSAAILAGIAANPSADVLVCSAADLPAIVESVGSGYQLSGADGVATVFGLRLIPLAGAAAGAAYVMRGSALNLQESMLSPVVLVDPYSLSSTNEVRVIGDVFAAAELVNPLRAVEVTVAGP